MADISGDIKVPGLGEVPKKRALLIGGIAVVVVAGVLIVRSRSASSAAAPAAAPAATDGTTDPSIDPNTGVPYADEGDGGAIDPATDIPYADEPGGGSYGAYPDNTNLDGAGYPIGSPADIAWQGQQQTGLMTNSEWLRAAETSLPGSQSTIQAALSGVLGGLTVTTAQKNLFLEAVGINGAPPQGYPLPIKTSDTAAHPGAPSGEVTVPNVESESQEDAFRAITDAGLKPKGSPVVRGVTLTVHSQSPKGGTKVKKGSVVTLTSSASKPPVIRK